MSQEKFIKYHWKQTISLLIIVIFVIGFNISLEEMDKNKGQVMGVATSNLEKQDKRVIEYQSKIKNLINNYLIKRSEFDQAHQDWLFLANKTKYQILSISVPDEYRELHLQLVTILDLEKQAVTKSDEEKINQVNQRWNELLEQYFWLN